MLKFLFPFLFFNILYSENQRGYFHSKENIKRQISGNAKTVVWFSSDLDPDLILLSHPKSGTNLTTGLIQKYTLKPLTSLTNYIHYQDANRLNLLLDFNKSPFIRTHKGYLLKKNQKKLIMLVRNYKESIIRNKIWLKDILHTSGNDLFQHFDLFLLNLQTYHEWDSDKKLLIYYEDLVSNPFTELNKILKFLEENEIDQSFLEDLEDTISKIKDSYHQQFANQGGCMSKGKDLLFHSQSIQENIWQRVDDLIKEKKPELWNYIKRYTTDS